jgi:monoamine oxidase
MAKFGLLPLAHTYEGPPRIDRRAGQGQHVVILGAGIGGLCAAYLLRNTKFSFLSGWMEGAVRSAELAVKRVVKMPAG